MKGIISVCAVVSGVTVSSVVYAQDPTAMGPFAVSTAEYDRGDEVFSCPAAEGCDVPNAELRAEVYYPTNLAAGPFPLLVFLHGRHRACYDRVSGASISLVSLTWPCTDGGAGFEPIPSYRGYDYLGRVLASHGYIVASISANGINAQDQNGASQGIVDRAHLVDAHLNLWGEFNTVGSAVDGAPFTSGFIGEVDLQRVGTMGHSRGGDGVANHFTIFDGSPNYHVSAVLPLAPTNFIGAVPDDVDLGVVLPYCDGDVYTLEGSLFYDRARYSSPGDESNKFTFLTLGSNHNFFNTVWTPDCWTPGACWSDDRGVMPAFPATSDDAIGSPTSPGLFASDPFCSSDMTGGRLTSAEQRGMGLAYMAAFFRFSIGGDTEFLPLLRGDAPPPPAIDPNVFVGFHAPESRRLDLNRLAEESELTETTLVGDGGLHGAVSASGLTPDRCGYDQANPCFPGSQREVHWSNFSDDDPTLSRARIPWDMATDSFRNDLPAGARDVSDFDVIQFRVGVDHLLTTATPVDFSVILADATSSAVVNTNLQLGPNDLFRPESSVAPSPVMNSLRLPLSLFTGINLADLRQVTLLYDGTPTGAVLLSDIAFVDDEEAAAPGCQASESFLIGAGSSVTNPSGGTAVHNSGSGLTRVGNGAATDGILSVGGVTVLPNAIVDGDIVSEGAIAVDPTATVSGAVNAFGAVNLPPLPTLPAFPPTTGGTTTVNPGPPVSLAPGSRTTLYLNSGGTLILGAGDYFFTRLFLNSSATIRVTPTTRVFVLTELAYRTPFLASSGSAVQPITLGFASTAVTMEAPFNGTLIAPNARVQFGIGAGLTFTGSFFGRILQVRDRSALVCLDVPAGNPPAPTCMDSTKNGNETGVDCGGPNCMPCAAGNPCNVASDCQSNVCTGGICQPSAGSVTATRVVTANWAQGYCVTLFVTNNSTLPTTNWSVSLNTNASSIYTSWNGTFSGPSGVISVTPSFSWNKVIPPGGTDNSVGFCANRTVSGSGTLPNVLSASGTF